VIIQIGGQLAALKFRKESRSAAANRLFSTYLIYPPSQGASYSSSSSSSSNPAARSDRVLEYCAKSELHPASAGLGMLKGRSSKWSLQTRVLRTKPRRFRGGG